MRMPCQENSMPQDRGLHGKHLSSAIFPIYEYVFHQAISFFIDICTIKKKYQNGIFMHKKIAKVINLWLKFFSMKLCWSQRRKIIHNYKDKDLFKTGCMKIV